MTVDMTFPLAFEWTTHGFEPIQPVTQPTLIVADSWRVMDGTTWGLQDHLARFMAGIAAQHTTADPLPNPDFTALQEGLETHLLNIAQRYPQIDFFPRLSVERIDVQYRVVLLVRPAPTVRDTTTLLMPNFTDPRSRPTVKGPDIGLLRGLVAEASTDDVVLHDGTNVIETTTGALLVWRTPQDLVLCQSTQQLASISAHRIVHHARSHDISVTSRPVTIQDLVSGEYPVWCTNTLHGISPVTTINDGNTATLLPSHPQTAAWQAAWWRRFVS